MNQHMNFRYQDARLNRVKIISSGIFLPDQIVKSDDLFAEFNSEANYGLPTDWMSRFIGIKERRMASSDAKPSDLAIPAAQMALDNCPWVNPDHIDSIYFCGIERDHPEPATAHIIQNALGLHANITMDVANACFGFISGMEAAIKDIKLGEARYALVVTGEVPTKVLNGVLDMLKNGMDLEQAKLILGGLTVGDAGGAVILGAADFDEITGFEAFHKRADSSHVQKCIYKMGDGGKPEGRMEMGPISRAAFKMQGSMIDRTLSKIGWEAFDWTLIHQTGSVQFERLASLRGLTREKMVKTYDKLGNITTATFPVSFNKLQKNASVSAGDKIGCCFSGSGLVIGQFGYTY